LFSAPTLPALASIRAQTWVSLFDINQGIFDEVVNVETAFFIE
jgi:hypothetical protein